MNVLCIIQSLTFADLCRLQDVDREDGKSEARTDGADGTEDSGEDDFDKYLNELNNDDGGSSGGAHQFLSLC